MRFVRIILMAALAAAAGAALAQDRRPDARLAFSSTSFGLVVGYQWGQGALDFPAIVAAASGARWLIVELDRCATDMLAAVEQSHRYLVQEGLGHA